MNSTKLLTIKKYISPLTSIIRGKADDTLGRVLSHVNSSHEAVFIFDNDNKFLGLISPFKTLYSSNYPYTTKVSSIIFNPPTITGETFVYQVAEYMLATRIYVLPVFNKKGELKGVISIKDILQEVVKDSSLINFISNKVKTHRPVTAPIDASVKEVFHSLKEKGVSRMVLVDAEERLAGIVTRSDLMQTLIKPTSKMRFPKEGSHAGFYSLAGEKTFRKDKPIGKYLTRLVDSLPKGVSKIEIVTHLISSSHDSVVLIDKQNKPTGFLSMRDILKAISLLRPEVYISLSIKKPSNSVNHKELEQARKYLEVFGKKLKKRIKIEKIEVSSEEPKSPEGRTKVFNITVIVTLDGGKSFVVVTKNRKYIDGIQSATKLIEKQYRRSKI